MYRQPGKPDQANFILSGCSRPFAAAHAPSVSHAPLQRLTRLQCLTPLCRGSRPFIGSQNSYSTITLIVVLPVVVIS